jgi:hypothetical protein
MIEMIEATAAAETMHAVDQLHIVREQLKALQEKEKGLKETILAAMEEEVEGFHVKAKVSYVAETESPDFKAVCNFLKVKPTILAKFMKKKAGYSIINIRPL